jgi:hypothetical protein
VPTAVVPYGRADVLRDLVYVGKEILYGARVCFWVLLESAVEVGDVSIVMFFVVEVHGLFVYVGL